MTAGSGRKMQNANIISTSGRVKASLGTSSAPRRQQLLGQAELSREAMLTARVPRGACQEVGGNPLGFAIHSSRCFCHASLLFWHPAAWKRNGDAVHHRHTTQDYFRHTLVTIYDELFDSIVAFFFLPLNPIAQLRCEGFGDFNPPMAVIP